MKRKPIARSLAVAMVAASVFPLITAGSAAAETTECQSEAGGGIMTCVRVELGTGGVGARAHASITDLNDGQNYEIDVSDISLWRETADGDWQWVRTNLDHDDVNPANFDEGRTSYHTCGGLDSDRYFAKAFFRWVPADGLARRSVRYSPVRWAHCALFP